MSLLRNLYAVLSSIIVRCALQNTHDDQRFTQSSQDTHLFTHSDPPGIPYTQLPLRHRLEFVVIDTCASAAEALGRLLQTQWIIHQRLYSTRTSKISNSLSIAFARNSMETRKMTGVVSLFESGKGMLIDYMYWDDRTEEGGIEESGNGAGRGRRDGAHCSTEPIGPRLIAFYRFRRWRLRYRVSRTPSSHPTRHGSRPLKLTSNGTRGFQRTCTLNSLAPTSLAPVSAWEHQPPMNRMVPAQTGRDC